MSAFDRTASVTDDDLIEPPVEVEDDEESPDNEETTNLITDLVAARNGLLEDLEKAAVGTFGDDRTVTLTDAQDAVDNAIGAVLTALEDGPYNLIETITQKVGDDYAPVDVDITLGLSQGFFDAINT